MTPAGRHRPSLATLRRTRVHVLRQPQAKNTRVLLVVAHPDDEYAFAATVYRLTRELDATVDQVVITNGEAGFRHSQLAEIHYGIALTDEQVGRSRLPGIRRAETLAAGRILGVRQHHFLEQKDARYTLDAGEALQDWNLPQVTATLTQLIAREQYDFVFVLAPTEDTHGHHQATAQVVTEALTRLPAAVRPTLLGAEPGRAGEPDQHVASANTAAPVFRFRRSTPLAAHASLTYRIVVNWMMAEHKSQGLFQNEQHDEERYWLLGSGGDDALRRTEQLFVRLNSAA